MEFDAYILTQSNKSCAVCPRCIKREQKRASRSKAGEEKSAVWDCDVERKAIIINNKEIIAFQSGVLDYPQESYVIVDTIKNWKDSNFNST